MFACLLACYFFLILSLWLLATRYSQGPWTDFDAKYAKTCGSAQGRVFSGSRTQNLDPHFPELAPFWGPFLTRLRKFSPKNRLTMGMLSLEHLLGRVAGTHG